MMTIDKSCWREPSTKQVLEVFAPWVWPLQLNYLAKAGPTALTVRGLSRHLVRKSTHLRMNSLKDPTCVLGVVGSARVALVARFKLNKPVRVEENKTGLVR